MKVLVIGAGIAGLSVARELALRNNSVCVIDKKELAGGTTTHCAGMLHSGARYVVGDIHTALLCQEENKKMRMLARQCIGNEQGLFTVTMKDEKSYVEDFQRNSEKNGFSIKFIPKSALIQYEKNLTDDVIGGFLTDDFVIDTRMLVTAYIHELKNRGVILRGNIVAERSRRVLDSWEVIFADGSSERYDFVVNAAGESSDQVAEIFEQPLEIEKVYGAMFRFSHRLTRRIVSRVAKNAPGDSVIPLCDGSLVGSTWSLQSQKSAEDEVDAVIQNSGNFVRGISRSGLIECWSGVRTHRKKSHYKNKEFGGMPRDYSIVKDQRSPRFVTILPGKLSLARHVAFESAKIILAEPGLEDISWKYPLPQVASKYTFYTK